MTVVKEPDKQTGPSHLSHNAGSWTRTEGHARTRDSSHEAHSEPAIGLRTHRCRSGRPVEASAA